MKGGGQEESILFIIDLNMIKQIVLFFLIFLFSTVFIFGWNKPGHMLTGAIAYADLKENDPPALAKVLELLKSHYYYPEWVKKMDAENIAEADRDLYLLMAAARWADDIREDKAEHRGKWHYINYPLKFENDAQTFPPDNDNLEKAWVYNVKLLESNEEQVKNKALTWIFHLAGDSHQPLHAVSLYSMLFQRSGGDRGGNGFFVKAGEDRATINLHSLWDGAITKSDKFPNIRKIAVELKNKYPKNKLEKLDDPEMTDWIQESVELAKKDVYLTGALKTGTEDNGELVPDGYNAKMKEVSEKRVVSAGYRLAAFLSKTF